LASIIGIGAIGYFGFIVYVYLSIFSGCGMDDGPFEAELIEKIEFSEIVDTFELKSGNLIIDNRVDTLSPIITFIENESVKWTLDTDVSKTKNYEYCRISKISNVKISEDRKSIYLDFTGYWTYGAEAGWMEIDKKDGENWFCLSW